MEMRFPSQQVPNGGAIFAITHALSHLVAHLKGTGRKASAALGVSQEEIANPERVQC
jgi:hypothetical protein